MCRARRALRSELTAPQISSTPGEPLSLTGAIFRLGCSGAPEVASGPFGIERIQFTLPGSRVSLKRILRCSIFSRNHNAPNAGNKGSTLQNYRSWHGHHKRDQTTYAMASRQDLGMSPLQRWFPTPRCMPSTPTTPLDKASHPPQPLADAIIERVFWRAYQNDRCRPFSWGSIRLIATSATLKPGARLAVLPRPPVDYGAAGTGTRSARRVADVGGVAALPACWIALARSALRPAVLCDGGSEGGTSTDAAARKTQATAASAT